MYRIKAARSRVKQQLNRIRIANYRVIYKIYEDEKLILIGAVIRRSEGTYKRKSDLFD